MRNTLFKLFVLLGLLPLVGVALFSQSWKKRQVQSNLGRGGAATPDVVGTFPGDPIQGITVEEFELFRIGIEDFLEVEDAAEGLGPVYNGTSCAQCHSLGGVGGAGLVTEIRVGRRLADGSFEAFPGGTGFQMFSIPTHGAQPHIPVEANVVAFRKALPLFGAGLIEAVPDSVFMAMQDPDDLDGDGIRGRAARVFDRNSGEVRMGRFGWKAQQSNLITFGAEAYRDEMGITSALFPKEACPFGTCEAVALSDLVPDPEDAPERSTGLRGIYNFDNFMKFLGPPPRGEITSQVVAGEEIFHQVGCAACHTPILTTGPSNSSSLNNKRFAPYADFLLHDIGTGDGIAQADAAPEEIRTAPLWGARFRAPFLHDGRAPNLEAAIRAHAGEAGSSRENVEALTRAELDLLLAFLGSL